MYTLNRTGQKFEVVMGTKYLKEEGEKKVLYEEGLLGDKELGELHEKSRGEYETRNIFGDNFEIKEQKDGLSDWFTPNAKWDYELKSTSGETGRFKFDTLSGQYAYTKHEQIDKSKFYDSVIDSVIDYVNDLSAGGIFDGLLNLLGNIIGATFAILFGLLYVTIVIGAVLMVFCLILIMASGLLYLITGYSF